MVKRRAKFKPSAGFLRLEKLVEEMRERDAKLGRPPRHDPTGPTPRQIGEGVEKVMAGVAEPSAEDAERNRLAAEESERDRVEALRLRRLERWRATCPAKYRETFDIALVHEAVDRAAVSEVLGWQYGQTGLVVIGLTDRSKTWTVHELVRRLAVEEGRRCVSLDGIGFANACASNFKESTMERWLESVLRADLVFIDDITKRFTAATQDGLFAVADRLQAALKPLLLTSNKTADEMRALVSDPDLGDPLMRRLRQLCRPVVF